jgi:hypothetical protein
MFPDKWYFKGIFPTGINLKSPEEELVGYKWYQLNFNKNYNFYDTYYYRSDGRVGRVRWLEVGGFAGFTEITYDDFIKYVVLKQEYSKEDLSRLKELLIEL